ncbi:helix-hairpin-helix domain-containing protein [Pontibacillus salicampi]|uniref:Helix-hairpin-helix domain-containing protein n=1 Tax=Pontibacillus salicampi TaxID=1449801 RepID=A0ABV6LJK0_9BACI
MNRLGKTPLLIVGVCCLIVVAFVFNKEKEPVEITSTESTVHHHAPGNEGDSPKASPYVYVDVKGEVDKPGVYKMEEGKRVKDVMERAGGMTEQADPFSVNLAQKLLDEMVITVQVKGGGGEVQSQSSSTSSVKGKVAVNQATVEELQTLPGIGESKAAAIIQFREENGPFSNIDDLTSVSGIGEKTVEGFAELVQVP